MLRAHSVEELHVLEALQHEPQVVSSYILLRATEIYTPESSQRAPYTPTKLLFVRMCVYIYIYFILVTMYVCMYVMYACMDVGR